MLNSLRQFKFDMTLAKYKKIVPPVQMTGGS